MSIRASVASIVTRRVRPTAGRAGPDRARLRPMRDLSRSGAGALLAATLSGHAMAGSWAEDQFHTLHPGQAYHADAYDRRAIYSFPINTEPDGWAALKAEPWGDSRRMTKVYDGTLFLVVGAVPGWKLVQFKSGERGWIAERLVGCCRPASH